MRKAKPVGTPIEECLHFHYKSFNYQISFDQFLELNDYCLDFKLMHLSSDAAIVHCDTMSLVEYINKSYREVPIINRLSAKIIATDNPALLMNGVPKY